MSHDTILCSLNISAETLSAWRSRLLRTDELEHLGAHIPTCAACQRHLQRFERIAQALRDQHVPPSGSKLWHGVQTAMTLPQKQPMQSPQRFVFGSLSAVALVVLLFVVFTTLGHNRNNQPAQTATSVPSPTSVPITPTNGNVTLMQISNSQSGSDFTAVELKVTATCPANTVLVGGGFTTHLSSRNNQLIFFTANYPSSLKAWTVEIQNPQTGGPVTLTTYATCLESSLLVTTTIVNAPANPAGATCPAGSTLLSGGYAMDSANLNTLLYSRPVNGSWWTKNANGLGPTHTYALCATTGLAPGKVATSSPTTIPLGSDGEAIATCDAGQIMTGGGYSLVGATPVVTQLWRELWNGDGNNQFSTKLYPVALQGGTQPTPSSVQLIASAVCVVPTH